MSIPLALWISTLLDGLVFGLILFVPWERHLGEESPGVISVSRLFLASLGALAVFLFKLPILILLHLDVFGLVHLVYLDLVVLLPLLGLGILVQERWPGKGRAVTPVARGLCFLALAGAGVGAWATFVEPFRLERVEVRVPINGVPGSPEAPRAPLVVGVLADLQSREITAHERGAVELLMARQPDLILIPGDIFQGTPEELDREGPRFRELLASLEAPGGVYAVPGNVDGAASYRRVLEGTGVVDLGGRSHTLEVRGRRVNLIGLEPTTVLEARSPRWKEILGEKAPGEVRLLLTHYPDPVLDLPPDSPVDLVVAGHTHGGQVCLPGVGPIVVLSRVSREVGAGGLHRVGGNSIYISRGVGLERDQAPRIRLFCRPEVSLLTLD